MLIETHVLGALENNVYLLADPEAKEAVIIDPSFNADRLLQTIQQNGWQLTQVWITHAHFDHIIGVDKLLKGIQPRPVLGLHPYDLTLWQEGGIASYFGFSLHLIETPNLAFTHGQVLQVGNNPVEVRHTPGHSPGHVVFYSQAQKACFCGDVIFNNGIGRTDVIGGNYDTLMVSITEQIFSLPGETVLYPGHGPVSTVSAEKANFQF